MTYLKHIPNFITLGNLVMGCIAIVLFSESSYAMFNYDEGAGDYTIRFFSEQLIWGSFFVFFAAVFDFFDGFSARLIKVASPLGEQLDSLADVVSFGVAPGVLLYEMLKYSWASMKSNLEVPIILLLPAVLIPCASAYRLAVFNIKKASNSNTANTNFEGMPTPAMALAVIALPWAFITIEPIKTIVYNPYTLYGIILIFSWLMVSKYPMYKLSFSLKIKNIIIIALLALVTVIGVFLFAYFVLFFTILAYIILSFFLIPNPIEKP